MKRYIYTLLHLFILLTLSACGAARQPSRLPDPDDVEALLVQLVDVEKRVPGIVVGMIAADPPERWVVGYGRLSATDTRVPDGDTVFEIGSITKVFTGILLAQAVLNGDVKLDDPISMYLPEGLPRQRMKAGLSRCLTWQRTPPGCRGCPPTFIRKIPATLTRTTPWTRCTISFPGIT